jgi:hypothetical protein
VENDHHCGQLKITSNAELVDKVCSFLVRDHQLTCKSMASELNVNKESIMSIITTDLGKWTIYSNTVLHYSHNEKTFK